jgi:3D (Asp-Asp-Asp) domain-containing protein
MAVAVDPNVIPLGTRLYVEGYGEAIASDTGGAIQGNIVDVHFSTYAECIAWGRRTVQVTILD